MLAMFFLEGGGGGGGKVHILYTNYVHTINGDKYVGRVSYVLTCC